MTAEVAPPRHSVLLGFQVENVRSFRDPTAFDLRAGPMSDRTVVREIETARDVTQVLPAAGVYGANGSGKSNLLRALSDMRRHVLTSFRAGPPTGGVLRHPFLLDPIYRSRASTLAIDVIVAGIRHEYGFEATDDAYVREWADHYPRGRRATLFERDGQRVDLGVEHRAKGRAATEILRPNALFLSTAASAAHPTLTPLYEWFSRNLLLADTRTRTARQTYTSELLTREGAGAAVLKILRLADPGIAGARQITWDPATQERMRRAARILVGEEGDLESLDDIALPGLGVRLLHQGADGRSVDFDQDDESFGTLVWFGAVGPILDALRAGCVFLADELDASLHSELAGQLVRIFQSHHTNRNRAQLIFNSHNPTLLGGSAARTLGRDQVWLVEKSETGASALRRLSSEGVRKDVSVSRQYLAGRFGAVPLLGDEAVDRAILEALDGE